MDTKYCTVEEIAELLRVDIKTVRRWIRSGELVAMDIGHGYRVSEEDLKDFIKRRSQRKKTEDTPEE